MTFSLRRRFALPLIVWCAVGSTEVGAVVPAKPEEVVCAYDYMVDATVISATRETCLSVAADGGCQKHDPFASITAQIRIERLLAARMPTKFGAVVIDEAAVYRVTLGSVPLSPDHAVEHRAVVNRLIHEGRNPVGADELRAVAQSNLVDYFVGGRFLFSLNASPASPPVFGGHAWLRADEPWIVETLTRRAGSGCALMSSPRDVKQVGSP